MENTFAIPNSKTTIRIYLSNYGVAAAQRELLNTTVNFVQAQLAASGDGQLPQAVDPFIMDLNHGAWLHVYSLEGQHMTWGIFNNFITWLYKHLGQGRNIAKGLQLGSRTAIGVLLGSLRLIGAIQTNQCRKWLQGPPVSPTMASEHYAACG